MITATQPDPHELVRTNWNQFAAFYNRVPGLRTPTVLDDLLAEGWGAPLLPSEPRRVIDVACGPGRTTAALRRRFPGAEYVCGSDLSDAMIDQARAESGEGLRFERAAAESIPEQDNSVDFLCCNLGLMLFPDPAAALRSFARVLAPSAHVRATVWGRPDHTTSMTLATDVARALDLALPQPPSSNFSLGTDDSIDALCRGTGLRRTASRYVLLRWPYAGPEEALHSLGLDPAEPGSALKAVINLGPEATRTYLHACRVEVERRLDAGGGELVHDLLHLALTRA